MFGIGFFEILFIAFIAFLILGPDKFPGAARSFLKIINELQRTFLDIKNEMSEVKEDIEKPFLQGKKEIEDLIKKPIEEIKETASSVASSFEKESDDE